MNRGYRQASVAVLSARQRAREYDPDVTTERSKLSAAARDAFKALDLTPATRLVLGELVGCWGGGHLKRGLMVWPSNDHLTSRTGLSERSVRLALSNLIKHGLIVPHDSANGKRFAVRSRDGEIVDAYGFDLSPVQLRAAEFAGILLKQRIEDGERKIWHEEMTAARRIVLDIAHQLDDQALHQRIRELAEITPSRRTKTDPKPVAVAWVELRALAEKLYQSKFLIHENAANAGNDVRHIESNNESPSEPCSSGQRNESRAKFVDLELLRTVCPIVGEFGYAPKTGTELVDAGKSIRPAIGAHASAWADAVNSLGSAAAAAMVIYVAQLQDDDVTQGRHRIKNPGGLFRSLVQRATSGDFDLAAELSRRRKRS